MNSIAVIGDVMLDKHVSCQVVGFSPEDDLCPKLKIEGTTQALGGAGNVAANLISIGYKNVHLFGALGDDNEGNEVIELLGNIKNHLVQDARRTTVKSRYITPHGRHAARIDLEDNIQITNKIVDSWVKILVDIEPKVIIISDYAKGTVTDYLMKKLPDYMTIVDPKAHDLRVYGKVFAITPNEMELSKALHLDDKLLHMAEHVVVTKGGLGCDLIFGEDLVNRNDFIGIRYGVRYREIGDPTGCGDSFIAGLGATLAVGANMEDACAYACAAGACAMDHKGTYAVTNEEWVKEILLMGYRPVIS